MAIPPDAAATVEEIRKVRQARLYTPDPVPPEIIEKLLEIARWTGSSRNTQPWKFIVVQDKEQLRKLSTARTPINWMADAPLGIAIVLDGVNPHSEFYDEGRITERLLIAARILGLGGGTAWYGDESQQKFAKEVLGVPDHLIARSIVVLGYPVTLKDHRPNANTGGRKPLSEIVSYDRFNAS